MWLNVILASAGLGLVGIIFAIVISRPRRWDSYVCDDAGRCGHSRAAVADPLFMDDAVTWQQLSSRPPVAR